MFIKPIIWRLGRISVWHNYDVSDHGVYFVLRKLIKLDFPKYLVDVGAGDGLRSSNSFNFIKSGEWKAILIEPLPDSHNLLNKRYARNKGVRCINKACAEKTGLSKLYRGKDVYTSTLCEEDNEWFREWRTVDSIIVKTDTLTNILTENHFPSDFSLLLIDAEGMDYEVLLGLDFNLFRPRIIVTEEYLWNMQKHNSKYQFLKDKGYKMKELVGCNAIWVKQYDELTKLKIYKNEV
ncbi:MAG: FkbM family methyltransferase [Candidatus Omnitrophica bacterium]|nr:FkbM family methyltransferase [Candidatus Omnitrophota bacterium]